MDGGFRKGKEGGNKLFPRVKNNARARVVFEVINTAAREKISTVIFHHEEIMDIKGNISLRRKRFPDENGSVNREAPEEMPTEVGLTLNRDRKKTSDQNRQ